MKLSLVKTVFFCIALTFSFSLISAAQTQQFKKSSANQETPKTIKAKREIIKLLLADFFKNDAAKEFYLSTKNIPKEIQTEFPLLEDLKATLTEPSSRLKEDNCLFEFRSFLVNEKKASVLFGDCNNGLGYNFKKKRGIWKIVPNQIVNPN